MYDFHIHSNFSIDCKFSMEDMVSKGLKKNMKCMCFTDHVEFDVTDKKIDISFHTEDYFKKYKQIKYTFDKNIEILNGVEIGMQPHLNKKYNRFIKKNYFDFVIMSIHTVNGIDVASKKFYKNKTPLEVITEYYTDLYNCLNNFQNFDVIGHIDLIDRYCPSSFILPDINEYEDLLKKILQKIIDMDKGIELNTSGIRYNLNYFHPKPQILKLYKQLGGEIITIGSDSHTPETVGYKYKEAEKLLKSLGYKYIFIFKNRKKIPIKI